ncbi:MAG TPA: TetR family transcriptional regulator [Longimicrobiales bacterium]
MARPREFDIDQALDAAMQLFWERGYEATSVADLVERLGIGRASLYAAFGDKHTLYLKALDRYQQVCDPNPIRLLSQPGPALPAVRALVRRYAETSAGDAGRRGCMVVNAAAERLPGDEAVARRTEANWRDLEAALEAALDRAREQGELAPDRDPRALARFLLVVLQGLRVVGKGRPDPDRLRDAAEQALSILE